MLGSTLILTWIPNSTLKRNPRSLESSPARGHAPRIGARRSPRQEYAKSDFSSTSQSPRSSLGSSQNSRRNSQGSLGSQPSSLEHSAYNNTKTMEATRLAGIGQNVNNFHQKTLNADRDQDDLPDSFTPPDTTPSSGSTSPTTERQLFMLLSKGQGCMAPHLQRERVGSSRSVTSIEMEGENLVVVTEETNDCAFDSDSPVSPPPETPESPLDCNNYTLLSEHLKEEGRKASNMESTADMNGQLEGVTEAGRQISSESTDTRDSRETDASRETDMSIDYEASASGTSYSSGCERDVVPDLSTRIRELQSQSVLETSTDTLTNSTDTLINSFHGNSSNELRPEDADRRASIEKLKESLELNLDPMTTARPEITVPDSPGGSSSTSGPDSRPPTPVTPPPFPLTPHSNPTSPLSPQASMNMQFPDNSVTYGEGSGEGSQNPSATEQICGVFSVDIGESLQVCGILTLYVLNC